jgi:hypothetical protein
MGDVVLSTMSVPDVQGECCFAQCVPQKCFELGFCFAQCVRQTWSRSVHVVADWQSVCLKFQLDFAQCVPAIMPGGMLCAVCA